MQNVEVAIAGPEIQRTRIDAGLRQDGVCPVHLDVEAAKGEAVRLGGNDADFHGDATLVGGISLPQTYALGAMPLNPQITRL
jgi:hypothetical protein